MLLTYLVKFYFFSSSNCEWQRGKIIEFGDVHLLRYDPTIILYHGKAISFTRIYTHRQLLVSLQNSESQWILYDPQDHNVASLIFVIWDMPIYSQYVRSQIIAMSLIHSKLDNCKSATLFFSSSTVSNSIGFN